MTKNKTKRPVDQRALLVGIFYRQVGLLLVGIVVLAGAFIYRLTRGPADAPAPAEPSPPAVEQPDNDVPPAEPIAEPAREDEQDTVDVASPDGSSTAPRAD